MIFSPLTISLLVTYAESIQVPLYYGIEWTPKESLTFFLLQLVAITLFYELFIGSIHRIAERIEEIKPKREPVFLDRENMPILGKIHEEAEKSIQISAFTFSEMLNVNPEYMRRKYQEGCQIKLLLLNPSKVEEASKMTGDSPNAMLSHIENSIAKIKEIKGEQSIRDGAIEAKLLPSFPGFGVFIIDGDTPKGKIKIELMPCKCVSSHKRPNVFITKADIERFEQFITHFNELWKISIPI